MYTSFTVTRFVVCVIEGQRYLILIQWFAVDRGDGLIDRLLSVSDQKTLEEFRYLWKQRNDWTHTHVV